MASRIAGITIEIGGNTTKLQKSLDGVNKKLKSTSTALKDGNKLLKLNPGNVNSWLKNGNSAKVSFKTAEKILDYVAGY